MSIDLGVSLNLALLAYIQIFLINLLLYTHKQQSFTLGS